MERAQKAFAEYLHLLWRDVELFLGTAILILGLFNWSSAKYCDGNTADYLSCTNPTTYYYYGAFEIVLIILGVFLVLLWHLKRSR